MSVCLSVCLGGYRWSALRRAEFVRATATVATTTTTSSMVVITVNSITHSAECSKEQWWQSAAL